MHGIATDSRPTATMSRARGPDCASSTPSMHHARDKPGVGHQWLPQHAAGVLLHERPDGRMRPSARGRTWDECMQVPASGLADALTLEKQRTHACYAGRVRGAPEAPPVGRSAAYRLESPEEACGGTNADREMVPTVSGMEARGVQRRVQQRSTVGRGSGRNANDEQRVCMHHLVQLFSGRN